MALIAMTIIGSPQECDEELEANVRAHLEGWFGPAVHDWRRLRTYRIRHALPAQVAPTGNPEAPAVTVRPGLFLCGEYRNVASLQWAMVSGRRAADEVVAYLE